MPIEISESRVKTVTPSESASTTVYEDPALLAVAVARRIAEIVAKAISDRGICRIALAGGETPRHCYEALRELPLPWSKVQLYFGDERCLPVADEHRNDTMVKNALLYHIRIPVTNIHPIPAEQGARVAASRYALEIKQAQPLDLVLLGLGEDGHTASLFPGSPALRVGEAAVAVFDAPKPPPERVSLSMATLNAARHKLFLVAGAHKRDALKRIGQGEASPAGQVLAAEWHVDRDTQA